jgi:hypothetical protein
MLHYNNCVILHAITYKFSYRVLRSLKFRLDTFFFTVFQNLLIPKSLEVGSGALMLGDVCLEAIVRLVLCTGLSCVIWL